MNRRAPVPRADSWRRGGCDPRRALLVDLYQTALAAVDGRTQVMAALAQSVTAPTAVIAIGKAAPAMIAGAYAHLGAHFRSGFVTTAAGYEAPLLDLPRVDLHFGDHPVPGAGSLAAGVALRRYVAALPPALGVLVLVSGGASSLIEDLLPGVALQDLQALNAWAHGRDVPIQTLNGLRRRLSTLKDGRLAALLHGRAAEALVLSDVPNDDPSVVGSGLIAVQTAPPLPWPSDLPSDLVTLLTRLAPPSGHRLPARVVGSLGMALDAIEGQARALGLQVERVTERVSGPAAEAGVAFAQALLASTADLIIAGGETTVVLPSAPGRGGRAQHLALAAAQVLDGQPNAMLLSAGTDGIDGASEDAGAVVDGGTVSRAAWDGESAAASLRQADAGRCLAASGDLIHTGPTTTNVGDLLMGLNMSDAQWARLAA